MILLIDNYDSFVFNLARYFERLGQPTQVVRNDRITVDEIRRMRPGAVVISPGPATPAKAGVTLEVVHQLHRELPILGVCLGHQAIGEALGGRCIRADQPVHGRAWPIQHAGRGVMTGLPNPLTGCRYHSLIVEQQFAARLPGDHGLDRGRHDHGDRASRAACCGHSVPSRVDLD